MGWFVKSILGLPKLDPGMFLLQDHPGKTGKEQSLTAEAGAGSLRSLLGCCLLDFSPPHPPQKLSLQPSLTVRERERETPSP